MRGDRLSDKSINSVTMHEQLRTYRTRPDPYDTMDSELSFHDGQDETVGHAPSNSLWADDDINTVKRIFQKRCAITAWQFNAVHAAHRGKVAAIRALSQSMRWSTESGKLRLLSSAPKRLKLCSKSGLAMVKYVLGKRLGVMTRIFKVFIEVHGNV